MVDKKINSHYFKERLAALSNAVGECSNLDLAVALNALANIADDTARLDWLDSGDLLSCPFCASHNVGGFNSDDLVECSGCNLEVSRDSSATAVDKWNTRDGVTHYPEGG